RPEPVAKRLNDVIRSNGDVAGAAVDHAEDGRNDAAYGRHLAPVLVARGRHRVVVPKQLVRTVDEINVQMWTPGSQYPANAMSAKRFSPFATDPPVEPMLAKLAEEIPPEGSFLYEPKWDGFRAIVFRGGTDVYIQSRDLRPLDRYFPELHEALIEKLPDGCVV